MSITVPATHPDPDEFEGSVRSAPDRYQVVEQARDTHTPVAVHDRFPTRGAAGTYAKGRTEHEPAMYGEGAAHELIVADTWGWRR